MPDNYPNSFQELPPASGHLTPQQIELAALRTENAPTPTSETSGRLTPQQIELAAASQGPTLEQVVLEDQNRKELEKAAQARASGFSVADLGSKAAEGIGAMAGKFGINIPFLKAGASTPSFESVLSSVASSAIGSAVSGITGKIGSLFGGKKGLLPDSLINNLVSSQEAKSKASAIKAALGTSNQPEDKSHLVSLTAIIPNDKNEKEIVEFLVMPEVVESRSVGYDPVAPAQFPGAFQKYKGTESTQWQINATLISRTSLEATNNLRNMNLLRGWTMPYFGENTRIEYPTRIGAPPPVLMLKGLRGSIIGPMPVVITSLSWNWPKDVDYIPATATDGSANNIPFPAVIQIAIQCVESLSTIQFNQFDLNDFKAGKMIDAFSKKIKETPPTDSSTKKLDGQTIDGSVKSFGAGGKSAIAKITGGVPKITEASNLKDLAIKKPFINGQGGDFGGGGAEGSFGDPIKKDSPEYKQALADTSKNYGNQIESLKKETHDIYLQAKEGVENKTLSTGDLKALLLKQQAANASIADYVKRKKETDEKIAALGP